MSDRGIPPGMEELRQLLDEDVCVPDISTIEPAAFESMLAGAKRAVQVEPGPRERLAALSSPLRLALGLTGALGVAGVGLGAFGLRGDLRALSGLRMGIMVAGLLGASGVAAALALRGPQRPPLRPGLRVLVGLLLALPLVSAAIPGAWEGMLVPPELRLSAVLKCLGIGIPVSVLASGVVLVFTRWIRVPRPRLVLAGLSGGLVGFAAQQLHCPAADPAHLLLSHASLGLLAAAALLGLARFVSAERQ